MITPHLLISGILDAFYCWHFPKAFRSALRGNDSREIVVIAYCLHHNFPTKRNPIQLYSPTHTAFCMDFCASKGREQLYCGCMYEVIIWLGHVENVTHFVSFCLLDYMLPYVINLAYNLCQTLSFRNAGFWNLRVLMLQAPSSIFLDLPAMKIAY